MNGMITTKEYPDVAQILPSLKAYTTGKVVEKVSCREKYVVKPTLRLEDNGPLSGAARFDREAYERGVREPRPTLVKELNGAGLRVALMDFGAKANIIRCLTERGCEVTVYPAWTMAEEIIADGPDGIMLSNGPGDPKECISIIKDLATGRVYISSQNHGYVVDMDKLDSKVAVPAFVNVNDGTNEGLSYTGKNIFTVQYHPEACPGPQDSRYLFDRFIQMIRQSEAREEHFVIRQSEAEEDTYSAQKCGADSKCCNDREEKIVEKGGAPHA